MLEEGLSEAFSRDDFCAEPLDDHIARLCLEMGLPEDAAHNWRDLPEPPDPPDLEEDDVDESETAAETSPPPPGVAGEAPQPQSSA